MISTHCEHKFYHLFHSKFDEERLSETWVLTNFELGHYLNFIFIFLDFYKIKKKNSMKKLLFNSCGIFFFFFGFRSKIKIISHGLS